MSVFVQDQYTGSEYTIQSNKISDFLHEKNR